MTIEQSVTRFIRENFLFSDQATPLSPTDSLMEAGLIDSTGVLELVAYLEQEFGIAMADADIVPANLDTIAGISSYVRGKQAAAKAA